MKELNTLSPKKWVANYAGLAPTIDSSTGVHANDAAVDTSNNAEWVCLNAAVGVPVWTQYAYTHTNSVDFNATHSATYSFAIHDQDGDNAYLYSSVGDGTHSFEGSWLEMASQNHDRAYRFRTSGGGLDLEAGGRDMYLSNWTNGNYSGTQHFYKFMSASTSNSVYSSDTMSFSATHDLVGINGPYWLQATSAGVVFNHGATECNFTINKKTSGTAYAYNATLDTHVFNGASVAVRRNSEDQVLASIRTLSSQPGPTEPGVKGEIGYYAGYIYVWVANAVVVSYVARTTW